MQFTTLDIGSFNRMALPSVWRLLRGNGVVLFGGDGVLSSSFLPLRGAVMTALSAYALTGGRIAVAGAGFACPVGSAPSRWVINSAVRIAKLSKIVAVRDLASEQVLANNGVAHCVCVGDPALHVSPERIAAGNNQKAIGFNIAAHDWERQNDLLPQIVECFVEAAQYFTAQGFRIRYFIHSDCENNVAAEFSSRTGADVVDEFYPRLLNHYADLHCFVGMMMHSTILACASRVPFIPVCYDAKSEYFLRTIGIDGGAPSVDDVTAKGLITHIDDVLQSPSKGKPEECTLTKLRTRYNSFIDDVANIVSLRKHLAIKVPKAV